MIDRRRAVLVHLLAVLAETSARKESAHQRRYRLAEAWTGLRWTTSFAFRGSFLLLQLFGENCLSLLFFLLFIIHLAVLFDAVVAALLCIAGHGCGVGAVIASLLLTSHLLDQTQSDLLQQLRHDLVRGHLVLEELDP